MAWRERSDGARRCPGEASKFVRGSSSSLGGGAGAGGARRGAAAGGQPEKWRGASGVKGRGGSAVPVGEGGMVALLLLFDRGRRLASLGGAESGVRLWGGSNFQFSRAL